MPAEGGWGRWPGRVLLLALLACLGLALASWPAWRTELPLWDLWPYAGPAFDAFDPAVILRAHNEHVPATSATVLWLDRWLAEGTYVLAAGVELGLIVFATAWAVRTAWRLAPPGSDERLLVPTLWLATLGSVAALQTAAHPFLLQHLLLAALAIAGARLVLDGSAPAPWGRMLAASLVGLLAVITQANGIALPFVLLLLDVLRRRRLPEPMRAALLVLPALALFLWLYLFRQGAPQIGGAEPAPLLFLDFLLRLAGTAAGMGANSEAVARLAGILVLLAAVPPALMLLLRPARLLGDPLGAAAATLFLLTASGLVGSAFGRAAYSPLTFFVKYGYYSLLFCGLVAYLDLRVLPGRWRRPWLLAAVSALVLVNAALLWRSPYIVERMAQQVRGEAAGYAFRLDTAEFCHLVECQPNHRAVLQHWQDRGLNVFAWPETRLLGRPVGSGAAGALPACAGGVDRVLPLHTGDGRTVLRVDGWLARPLEPREPLYVVAEADPQRLALGFGFASDLPAGSGAAQRQPWRAYFAADETAGPFALVRSGETPPCRLGPLAAPSGD